MFQGNSVQIKNNALPEHNKYVTELSQKEQVTSWTNVTLIVILSRCFELQAS